MKKIILTSILLLAANAFGQTKGSWYLGGSAGFSMRTDSQGTTTVKQSSWSASPEIGTFLTDHIQLGLGITSNGSSRDISSSKLKTLQFGGMIYSRYLFGNGAFRPFLGISASYLGGESNLYTNTYMSRISTINANFSAGFAYYVTPRIGIFGSVGVLGYTISRATYPNAPDLITQDFGFDASTLGNRFTIGMYYTICKGKNKE